MSWRCREGALVLLLVCFARISFGQTNPDSLKAYELAELVIGGDVRHSDHVQRLYRVTLSTLARQDKADVAGVLRQLPSAHVQTNSRGETLVYVRAAGERQVAVFLDGAPLNVGWDNRIDLSMIPANVLGNMTLERGAVSAAYGPNVSGGAVNLHSRSLTGNTSISELTVQAGSPWTGQSKLMVARRRKQTSFLVGGTLFKSDGMRVPSKAHVPFSQSDGLRTNSDRSSSSAYLRLDREWDERSVGMTVFHTDSEKGVPPEGHLDPAQETVRYWRYPLWRNTMFIANGISRDLPVHFSSTIWASRFQQHISQYRSLTYSDLTARQEDLDLSAGMRGIAEWSSGKTVYRGIGFVSSTVHRQVDIEVDSSRESEGPEMKYSNVLYSVGAEISTPNGMGGQWVAGLSMDGMNTPSSADKPKHPGFVDWSLNLEADFPLGDRAAILVNGGSKPRFPTLRELYGVALDRFVLNNDLKSERTWMAESGLQLSSARFTVQTTAFVLRTIDTIDQENVIVEGVRKRKRINLDGSRTWGLEVSGALQLNERVKVDGNATWLRPVAITGVGERHLTEKPEMMVTLNAEVVVAKSLRMISTIVHVGRAYGLGIDNEQFALPLSTLWNLRLSKSAYFSNKGLFLDAFAGVDNIFDTLSLPQLGLPGEGRSARVGINLSV